MTDELVGDTKCHPLVLWGEIRTYRRANARHQKILLKRKRKFFCEAGRHTRRLAAGGGAIGFFQEFRIK
ncbi:MAG: hypothetical protein COU46_00565 [Candidatus Niyogibacteria bacterium CG10_big_fil_rev_8_21_14_0_10_42_19]|uniref:Uncharacterized protein n=1 Tax=Candidatus Niyogibacteria bacterium CG10_big_fil_rev_8_21_14_0_10_42_19 TaxID=1974725 RepID=A0A2H0TI18_9BACT|nr:MAG: hypothetical protein COU46_00565 [Candidatus Niyogibacteria bacterium CG10_big_fil_rev_8_21_14_0_10_42_19]